MPPSTSPRPIQASSLGVRASAGPSTTPALARLDHDQVRAEPELLEVVAGELQHRIAGAGDAVGHALSSQPRWMRVA